MVTKNPPRKAGSHPGMGSFGCRVTTASGATAVQIVHKKLEPAHRPDSELDLPHATAFRADTRPSPKASTAGALAVSRTSTRCRRAGPPHARPLVEHLARSGRFFRPPGEPSRDALRRSATSCTATVRVKPAVVAEGQPVWRLQPDVRLADSDLCVHPIPIHDASGFPRDGDACRMGRVLDGRHVITMDGGWVDDSPDRLRGSHGPRHRSPRRRA